MKKVVYAEKKKTKIFSGKNTLRLCHIQQQDNTQVCSLLWYIQDM